MKRVSLILITLVTASLVLTGVNWQRIRSMNAAAGPAVADAAEREVGARIRAEGRLVAYPGAEVTVGTDVGGTIKTLPVLEKTVVKKGDLLAEIDASEQKAAYAEARARVKEAEVDMKLYDVELRRSQSLFATSAVAQDTVDRSEHDLSGAAARKETAAATAWRLGTVVAKTHIVSPIDGVVIARLAEAGETVPQGSQLVTICDLSRTRIEAEVDEYDAARVVLGAEVQENQGRGQPRAGVEGQGRGDPGHGDLAAHQAGRSGPPDRHAGASGEDRAPGGDAHQARTAGRGGNQGSRPALISGYTSGGQGFEHRSRGRGVVRAPHLSRKDDVDARNSRGKAVGAPVGFGWRAPRNGGRGAGGAAAEPDADADRDRDRDRDHDPDRDRRGRAERPPSASRRAG